MSTCKRCGLQINWIKQQGRWFCYNPDGTDHWDACSAERWRVASTQGKRFTTQIDGEKVTGFNHKGRMHRQQIDPAYTITGPLYQPFACVCSADVMPWDECPDCPQQQAWLAEHHLIETDPLLAYLDRHTSLV